MAPEVTAGDILLQIVDDHEALADGLGRRLRGPGIHLLPGVRSVESVDPQAQVVICDLVLRGAPLTGRRAIEYLVSDLGMSVVATSGFARPALITDAIAAGASSFVSKDGPFPPNLWKYAIDAATGSGRFLTSRLAEALLKDAQLRPLPTEKEYGDQARALLRAAVQEADSEVTRHHRQWDDPRVRAITASIWRVARERTEAHSIEISDVLRRAAVFERQGMKQADIARELGMSTGAYRGHLGALLTAYRESIAATKDSYLKTMGQTDLLLHLLDLEDDAGDRL